jgi:hypothetical protein
MPLIEEYDLMVREEKLDIPAEVLPSVRGLVYEELAEVYSLRAIESGAYAAKAKYFACLSYKDLSSDEWFKKLESERLERIRRICEEK